MTDQDYKKLAKQFMDLWEKQVSSMMSEKDFMRSSLAMMQGLGSNPSMGHHVHTQQTARNSAFSTHDNVDGAGQLAERLERVEERLSRLEDALAKRSAAKSSSRSKPSGSIKKRRR